MSNLDYYFNHCIFTGINSFKRAIRTWIDFVLLENYGNYILLEDDDPFTECRAAFWNDITESDVLSKEFLKYIQDIVSRIDSGEEKLIEFKSLDDLDLLE